MAAQGFEQLAVARRIAYPNVIHRIDDSATEEMRPDAVCEVLAEERIIRRGEPHGESDSRIFPLHVGRIAAQELRWHWAPIQEMLGQRGVGIVVDVELARLR